MSRNDTGLLRTILRPFGGKKGTALPAVCVVSAFLIVIILTLYG